jgi:hypothetical protein
MANLPSNGDSNWGTTLNTFLLVSHETDGFLKIESPIEVKTDTNDADNLVEYGRYACDTSSAAFTLTLPGSPTAGRTRLSILDYSGTFGTNSLTILRNGNNIMGLAEDMVCDVDNARFTLVYVDSTKGWMLL